MEHAILPEPTMRGRERSVNTVNKMFRHSCLWLASGGGTISHKAMLGACLAGFMLRPYASAIIKCTYGSSNYKMEQGLATITINTHYTCRYDIYVYRHRAA